MKTGDTASNKPKKSAQMRRLVHYKNYAAVDAQRQKSNASHCAPREGQQSSLELFDHTNDSLDGSKFEEAHAPIDQHSALGVLSFRNSQMPKTASLKVRPKIRVPTNARAAIASPPERTDKRHPDGGANFRSVEPSIGTKRSQRSTAVGASTFNQRKLTEVSGSRVGGLNAKSFIKGFDNLPPVDRARLQAPKAQAGLNLQAMKLELGAPQYPIRLKNVSTTMNAGQKFLHLSQPVPTGGHLGAHLRSSSVEESHI